MANEEFRTTVVRETDETQAAVRIAPQKTEEDSPTEMSANSKARWRPVAISFLLAIFLNALVILVVDRVVYRGQLGQYYLVLCLPVSAVILGLGAGAGRLLAKRFGGSPWRGAMIGVWIGAIASIALSLWGLLDIGPGT